MDVVEHKLVLSQDRYDALKLILTDYYKGVVGGSNLRLLSKELLKELDEYEVQE